MTVKAQNDTASVVFRHGYFRKHYTACSIKEHPRGRRIETLKTLPKLPKRAAENGDSEGLVQHLCSSIVFVRPSSSALRPPSHWEAANAKYNIRKNVREVAVAQFNIYA